MRWRYGAAVLLACVGASGYLIDAAPEILPEVALNGLLASCLTGASSRRPAESWAMALFRRTWLPLAGLLVMTVGLSWLAHEICPGAVRLMQALECSTTL